MLLMLVAGVGLAIALVMSAIAWRLALQERRRSDARVAALAAELSEFRGSDEVQGSAPNNLWNVGPSGFLNPGTAEPRNPGTSRRWLTVAAAGAIVVVLAIGAIVTLSLRARSREAAAQTTATAAAVAQPLELVSLTYERAGDQLIVKGFVRNPPGAKPVARVSAVVFLFDREGAFVTSGRALVDFLTLTPGEESPFVVQIPGAASVGRYRVSFRNADGTVMPHVDRRANTGPVQAVRRQES